MSDTIQALARALNADINGINMVSHNVANINTPGYQSVRAVADFGASVGLSRQVVFGDGPLRSTGRSLDLALRGEGFFVVDRGGQPLLTRQGSFIRDAQGYLATPAGDRVITDGGPVSLPDGAVRVDEQGVLWSGDQRLAQITVVTAEPGRLLSVEGGYRYDGELGSWSGRVQQGATEQSNVDAAAQTLQLIELTRHAESVQRVVSIYDRTLDVGINRIGDN